MTNTKPTKLYHCTTPKKAKLYGNTGHICSPVRGFDTKEAAMAWCIKTGRTVIFELTGWGKMIFISYQTTTTNLERLIGWI